MIEIEKKFLVKDVTSWAEYVQYSYRIIQGYIPTTNGTTVRIRVSPGKTAWLTVKGKTEGISRPEYEYEIPVPDGIDLLKFCTDKVEKTRFVLNYKGKKWELDVFAGDNKGLILAEVELFTEEEVVEVPPFVGADVTAESKYYNCNLVTKPFTKWD